MQGTNTVLIVILILLVAAFGAYWYTQNERTEVQDNEAGLELKITGEDAQ